jgi:hypothetical protein
VNLGTTSRREFLRGAVRYPLLGALAVMGGHLAARRLEAGATCPVRPWCGGCDRFMDCPKPQAETVRQQATVAAAPGKVGQR